MNQQEWTIQMNQLSDRFEKAAMYLERLDHDAMMELYAAQDAACPNHFNTGGRWYDLTPEQAQAIHAATTKAEQRLAECRAARKAGRQA